MTEAMWVELIRIVPTLIWLVFAVAALLVARRIFAPQAHRMTRVETPFVSVELAQEAIQEAERAGRASAEPPPMQPLYPAYPPSYQANGGLAGGAGMPGPGMSGGAAGAAGGQSAWGIGSQERLPRGAPPVPPKERTETSEPDSTAAPVPVTSEAGEDAPAEPDEFEPTGQPQQIPPQQRFDSPVPAPHSPNPFGPETRPRFDTYPPLPSPNSVPEAQRGRGQRAATRLARSTELLQHGRLLWVDDSPSGNLSLIRLFRTAGMTVEQAQTTDEAIRMMREGDDYDLVISDMTRYNESAGARAGVELLDRMVGDGHPTPAIIYTTASEARAVRHPRAAGATGNPEELVHLVIDLMVERLSRKPGPSAWRQMKL